MTDKIVHPRGGDDNQISSPFVAMLTWPPTRQVAQDSHFDTEHPANFSRGGVATVRAARGASLQLSSSLLGTPSVLRSAWASALASPCGQDVPFTSAPYESFEADKRAPSKRQDQNQKSAPSKVNYARTSHA